MAHLLYMTENVISGKFSSTAGRKVGMKQKTGVPLNGIPLQDINHKKMPQLRKIEKFFVSLHVF